jgi:hypothetical protein
MSPQLLFWILMLLWLVVGGIWWRSAAQPWPVAGMSALPFILFVVLGWQVFGQPIK